MSTLNIGFYEEISKIKYHQIRTLSLLLIDLYSVLSMGLSRMLAIICAYVIDIVMF